MIRVGACVCCTNGAVFGFWQLVWFAGIGNDAIGSFYNGALFRNIGDGYSISVISFSVSVHAIDKMTLEM